MKTSKTVKNYGTGNCEATDLYENLETFDDVLPYVGDFGRYQLWLLLSLFPFSLGYASLYFSQFFLTIVPQEHWCRINELVEANTTQQQRISLAIPPTDDYPYYDRCHKKDLNYSEVLRHGGIERPYSSLWEANRTVGCSRWEYNFTQIPYASIASELDWVCDREYLISTAQAIFFCGSIVGGFLIGWIADHKGRIPALMLCNGVALAASAGTANATDFWSFAVCRFLSGMAFDNCINIPLIIAVEYMAVKRRTLVVNIAFGVFFALGSTALPWISYYIANWRYLAYVSAIPMLSVFVTPWILPESARWYVSNRKTERVVCKLKRIARINKRNPDPRVYERFARNIDAATTVSESATALDLFKTPRLAKNTILLVFFWFLTVASFDGHVYALKLLHSSVFVSFSLACATEFPAGVLLTLVLDRWGRRLCGLLTLTMTCLLTVCELLLNSTVAKLTMSVLSRFCLNMAANIGLQYATELLPTTVRAQGVSLIHIFGIIAHSLAPYIVDSAKVWDGLPMLIIATASFTGAALVMFLPETLGRDLPQTLKQGEEFGKDQMFWNLPCLQKTDFDRRSRA